MTTQINEEPIDVSLAKQGVVAVDMPFDRDKEDLTWWTKHGISSMPLLIRAEDGTIYDDHAMKGIFKKRIVNRKVKKELRKLVSRKYVIFPNEECNLVVRKFIDEYGSEFGLELYKTHTAYNGDAQYWELRTKKEYEIAPNDKVQLGAIVRNSLGCNVSFGLDLFTFRLVCQNGAIKKGQDLMSLKIPHYGKESLKLMNDSLYERMRALFVEGQEIIKQYKIAAKLKLRQEVAELIAKKVTNRYIPDYVFIDPETKKVKLSTRTSGLTFWKLFNDITENVWHNNALGFLTKADITNVMHYVMKNEIAVAAK